ncbi:MAG TPA: beta-propeller fold lactonase family protein [Bryobacteraceae bacterium]
MSVKQIAALACLAWCAAPGGAEVQTRYSSPEELALSVDGRWLYVACTGRDEIAVIDTQTRRVAGRVSVGRRPRGLAVSLDSRRVYVANSWDDTVSEVDAHALRVVRTLPVGQEPIGVALDGRGFLYAANRIGGDVSVVDLNTGKQEPGIPVGRGASYAIAAPDHDRVYFTRIYPAVGEIRDQPQNDIAEIETGKRKIAARMPLAGAGAVFHAALSGGGRFGVAALLRPKNLIPTAHVEHGGIFGNSMALFGPVLGRVVMLPLDEIENYFAQPFDVAISPDLSRVFVSGSGADEVAILDGRRLLETAAAAGSERLANDLAASARYVLARVAVGRNPRGIALSPGGRRLYVANRLDDTVSILNAVRGVVIDTVPVGETVDLTPERRGEQSFFSARFSFGRQFSCASCHVDALTDGLSWDLEQDGFGLDVVATRSLESLAETAPYKWNGTTPDLETECGAISERYFFRSQGFRGAELADVVKFLKSIPVRPNRNRRPDGQLTAMQVRGKAIFDRKKTNDGRLILSALQCRTCHDGPYSTSGELADVGTRKITDRTGTFDTPHLTNTGYKQSYLHDGSAKTLKEIWTIFNPHDLHGVTSDLTSSDLDDLVEYLKIL